MYALKSNQLRKFTTNGGVKNVEKVIVNYFSCICKIT